MKNRDKVLYMLLGAFLVVLGMVLNHSIDNADANTQADLSLVREVIKMVEEAYPGSVDIGEVSILDTVVCKRVLCVNNEGMLLGSMGFTHEDGGFLTLLDQREKKLLTLLPGDKDVISYKNKKTDSYDKNLFSLGLDGNDNGVLSLHNKVGTNTSTLGHDKTGDGGLWLHDKAGTNTSILGHNEDGYGGVEIYNKSGIRTARLGHTKTGDGGLWLHDKAGTNTSTLGHDEDGHGGVEIYNKSGIRTARLGHTKTGDGALRLHDKVGTHTSTLGNSEIGNGGLWLYDKAGTNTSILGHDEDGHGGLSLYNKSGILTSLLGNSEIGNGGLWLHDKAGTNTSILGHDENGNNSLICENLVIQDKNARQRAFLGKDSNGDPMLKMYGDDDKHEVAYLGVNTRSNEMMFELNSKSKTDKGKVRIMMSQWGGIMACFNNMEKPVANLGIGDDGSGFMFTTDKYGYRE